MSFPPRRTVPALFPKDASEVDVLPFDFASSLRDPGEVLASAQVAASVYTGADATPDGLLDGVLQIQGARVLQRVRGGLPGVTYLLRCTATLNTGRVLVAAGLLPVVQL